MPNVTFSKPQSEIIMHVNLILFQKSLEQIMKTTFEYHLGKYKRFMQAQFQWSLQGRY